MTTPPGDRRTPTDSLALVGGLVFAAGIVVLAVVVVANLGLGADLPGWFVATAGALVSAGFAGGLVGIALAVLRRRGR